MEENSSAVAPFPPFPAPPAEDAITRLQYLLNNSLQIIVDAIMTLPGKAPSRLADFSLAEKCDKEISEELDKEIVDRADRLGLVLETMENEIDKLPDSTKDETSWVKELRLLEKENENAAAELEELASQIKVIHSITRKQLKLITTKAANFCDEQKNNFYS